MRPPSDSKSPRPVSRRGLCNSCDVVDMPVICPTCQIIWSRFRFTSSASSIESLYRRCGIISGDAFGSLGRWRRRADPGGRLLGSRLSGCKLSRSGTGSCGTSNPGWRSGPPNSPGPRDRRPCGISNQRTRHRTHGSQHYGARYRAQGSASSTFLRSRFERKK